MRDEKQPPSTHDRLFGDNCCEKIMRWYFDPEQFQNSSHQLFMGTKRRVGYTVSSSYVVNVLTQKFVITVGWRILILTCDIFKMAEKKIRKQVC